MLDFKAPNTSLKDVPLRRVCRKKEWMRVDLFGKLLIHKSLLHTDC